MKKIFQSILFLMLAVAASAQNPSFSPASFTAEDQVTLTIDVSGTPMAGQTDAYIWIFSDGVGNGNVNGDWGNSSEAAKMTNVGTNKWSFTFIGTVLFGRPPADLKNFGFLLKKKDGSAQTQDYKPFPFDPLTFTATMLRVFPAKVSASDVVSVNFDRSLGVSTNEQRMTPTHALVSAYDETGAQVGTEIEVPVRVLRANIWIATFIPTARFTPTAGHTLFKFSYRFKGNVLNTEGATSSVTSSAAEVVFTNLQ